MRPSRQIDATSLPPDDRPARRFRVHPTPSGVVTIIAVALFPMVAPEVADPGMAGFVWAALIALVLVGAVVPCATVLFVRVDPRARASTRPIRVGDATSVELGVGARLAEVALTWVDDRDSTHVGPGPATDVDVPLVAARRGRFSRLAIRVGCDAPFGLVHASRAALVDLERPLDVGPRPIPVERLPEPDAAALGEAAELASAHGGDTTRSVRPYVVGDPAHLVHWPTSARTGALVVREMEPTADRAVAVVVELGVAPGEIPDDPRSLPLMPTTRLGDRDDRAVEGAVARAAAIVAELRAADVRVLLCTAEPRPTAGEVGDDDATASRLAAATGGVPGPVPPGWSVRRVTPLGDRG